jgi:four helix bundle protein
LNIAEGSTGQTDPEQNRFLGMAVRSLIETVACQRIIARRNYVNDRSCLEQLDLKAQALAKRLHGFRRALSTSDKSIGEAQAPFYIDEI